MRNLIGFSAKKQSGKDTTYDIIQKISTKYNGLPGAFLNQKFAEKLKVFVADLICCDRSQLENDEFKNTPLPETWWIYDLGKEIKPYGFYSGVDKEIADERYLVKTTPRKLLEIIGTPCLRGMVHPDVWVNSLFSWYRPSYKWVITDVRFPNEVKRIKEEGGIIIRINRDIGPRLNEPFPETALDDYQDWDYVIDNDGTMEELEIKIEEILKLEGII